MSTENDRPTPLENSLPTRRMSRRQLLAGAATLGAGAGLAGLPSEVWHVLAATPAAGSSLQDIEHVIIFIQENRSYDHYFGRYKAGRGFSDPSPLVQPANGKTVFYQPDSHNIGASADPPAGYLLPFHLDTRGTAPSNASCTSDLTHDWEPQHQSWNNGAMDRFAQTHLDADPTNGHLTMGYYDRRDLDFFYAVADNFTLCDRYHCSVIGPTDPNRLYTFSATIDPDGRNGGPLIQTLVGDRQSKYGTFTWLTMPEVLQDSGVAWKVYAGADANTENNVLLYFKQYNNPTASPNYSQLVANAFGPTFPGSFQADVAAGTLPAVSWVLAPLVDSEHPPAPVKFGENSLDQLLTTLAQNPAVWAKTAVFYTYDENGGFFDHIPPPVPTPGTSGEYLTAIPIDRTALPAPTGPIGLGFRVPMLVISPFSRGGQICSDVFDHTSVLKFLATRFGVTVPNLTTWRDQAVGDMTSAFNFATPNTSFPALPATAPTDPNFYAACTAGANTTPYPLPTPQSMPAQENGAPTASRVSSFSLHRGADIVELHWRVTAVGGIAGFDLFAGKHRLNRHTIPPHAGRDYRFKTAWSGRDDFLLRVLLVDGGHVTVQAR